MGALAQFETKSSYQNLKLETDSYAVNEQQMAEKTIKINNLFSWYALWVAFPFPSIFNVTIKHHQQHRLPWLHMSWHQNLITLFAVAIFFIKLTCELAYLMLCNFSVFSKLFKIVFLYFQMLTHLMLTFNLDSRVSDFQN